MNLKRKTAIITGSASGIGAETTKAMAESGANLILLDINAEGLKAQKETLKKYPIEVITYAVDLMNYDEVQKTGAKIFEVCNRIDILANIAGGGGADGSKPISEINRETWDRIINLNMGITFNCTKLVIDKMIYQQSGRIINVSSAAGLRGGPAFGKGAYASSKAGVNGFTQTLAKELGPYGILVNAVAPGLCLTPLTHASNSSEAMDEFIKNKVPLKQYGDVSKIAKLIVFLASDDNQYMTGDIICVDGGLCMH